MARKKKRRARVKPLLQPKVDVVMPVYGGPELLLRCLESMQKFTAGIEHTVTLVDDVSPVKMDSAYDAARAFGYNIVHNSKNLGFAGACNAGVKKGRAPWILLLNTDVLITHSHWLKMLVEEGEAASSIGVVGCLLTFFPEDTGDDHLRPPGRAQHAGVVFDILGRPYHIFAGWSPDHPKVQQRRELNCVTGACLLTRRSLWRRLGGLDTDYGPGNFEDVQYCIQARMAGFRVVYTPRVHLHHYAGGSENSKTAQRNAQLFKIKMGAFVEYDEWRHW
jgi:GT2 family glycosyltransferase